MRAQAIRHPWLKPASVPSVAQGTAFERHQEKEPVMFTSIMQLLTTLLAIFPKTQMTLSISILHKVVIVLKCVYESDEYF